MARRPKAAHAAPAAARSALRNGLAAAAATGGTLALAVPVQAFTSPNTDPTALWLAAGAAATHGDLPEDLPENAHLLASIVPVRAVDGPEPPQIDVAGLLKAVGLADIARKAAEERAAREAAADCEATLRGLGSVKPWVERAVRFLSCLYDHPRVIGVAGRARESDHPSGLAVDLMVRGERGDRIAECALRNRKALGITYVIWKQRINYGDGWQWMEDRGSPTENHYDHVHISFSHRPPDGWPEAALCR